ncbi:hypothetical protein Tco_0901612 [Tanacetum coccineum]
MPIWKDASYFDSLSNDVDNGEPKYAADDQKQVEDNENDAKDKFDDDSSPKEVNVAGPHVNNASPGITTGSFKLNVVGLTVNTAFMEFESAHDNTTAKLPILKLAQENGTSVTKMFVPITAEEKTNKKNDVKARSLLLMALLNEHQLTFSQYTDAKTMFSAIKTRFEENLLTLFSKNRLQEELLVGCNFGVVISQEDLNSKFLSSLHPEWNTHVVVWMNKPEIETMSIDDLYNNFKIVEQKVKKSVGASSVSTTSPDVNTASPQVSTASFSDNALYAFMVENPNGSNLLQQDLEQIYEDDLEAMDLKWQLSLLSMRAKRECRAPRSKEGQFRNQDNTRKQGNNGDTSSKEMLAIDGVGFDWSNMAEE